MTSNFINDVTFSFNASIGDRRSKLVPGDIITRLAKSYGGIPNESINDFISSYEDPDLDVPSRSYYMFPLFVITGDVDISLMYLGVKTRDLKYSSKGPIETCLYKVLVMPITKIFWLSEDHLRDIAIINALNEVFTWK